MARQLPHLIYLQAFEAAARHLSFTRAAEELNCTQAAISQRIRGLEQYFGRHLFLRKANGLELSQAGQAYLPGITQALDVVEASTRGLTGRRARQSLTVSAPISFLNLCLAPLLEGFLAGREETAVRLNGAIWTDPNVELADVSIAITEREMMAPDAVDLGPARLVLAAAKQAERRIEVQGKYPLWDLWGQPGETGATLRVDTAVTALDLVAAGIGQTVVYEPYALGARARGAGFELGPAVNVGHVLTVRANPDRPRSALAGEFIGWLSGHCPAVE